MNINFINYILALATRHESRNVALVARGDEGICLLHCIRKEDGNQEIFPFLTREAIKEIENSKVFSEEARVLGFYTVDQRVLELAGLADVLLATLVGAKKVQPLEVTFSQQLISRLLASSEVLNDKDVPTGYSFWRLCLVGTKQDVYAPSDIPSGGLSLLPGKVLGDFCAPKDLVSATQQLVQEERQKELQVEEAHKEAHRLLSSIVNDILKGLHRHEEDDLGGIDWRKFGNN